MKPRPRIYAARYSSYSWRYRNFAVKQKQRAASHTELLRARYVTCVGAVRGHVNIYMSTQRLCAYLFLESTNSSQTSREIGSRSEQGVRKTRRITKIYATLIPPPLFFFITRFLTLFFYLSPASAIRHHLYFRKVVSRTRARGLRYETIYYHAVPTKVDEEHRWDRDGAVRSLSQLFEKKVRRNDALGIAG